MNVNRATSAFAMFAAGFMTCVMSLGIATAQRAIPDDNLAYPVLLLVGNAGFGSGFF